MSQVRNRKKIVDQIKSTTTTSTKPTKPTSTQQEPTKSNSNGTKTKNTDKQTTNDNNQEQVGVFRRFLCWLVAEDDDASVLATFRIMWGLIMMYEAWTYMINDWNKMIYSFYNSGFAFKYLYFEWCVAPEDQNIMKLIIMLIWLSALFVTIGFFYRTSALAFFLLFSWTYLLEQGMYLNHFYLVCVICLMMVFLPCNSCYSVDAYLWPRIRKDTAPKWCLFWVKALLVTVYTYAGIAKMNEDWMRAEPLKQWLLKDWSGTLPNIVGDFLNTGLGAYWMSWGGLIYDTFVGFALLFKVTRWPAIAATIFFHLSNKLVFNIGIFPWMMIASTSFFLHSSWPRYLIHSVRKLANKRTPKFVPVHRDTKWSTVPIRPLTWPEIILLTVMVVFLAHQILFPLRHHLYPGDVAWNEYGHKFSWRMKLRTKKCLINAFAYQPAAKSFVFQVPLDRFLPRKFIKKMAGRPEMLAQLGNFLGDYFKDHERDKKAEVYFYAYCRLNGRPLQRIVDPKQDMSVVDPRDQPYPWVTEVAPLPPNLAKELPWNWEWSWEYLSDILGYHYDPERLYNEYQKREREVEKMAERDWYRFQEHMQEKHTKEFRALQEAAMRDHPDQWAHLDQ